MIKVQTIYIEHFRGIRSLRISLSGENLAIKGPNGSGKSGIVDAVEFALTGNITRLTGVGSSAVSIRAHAPHVDCKENPEKAKVVLELSLPSGTLFSVERCVASPSKPILRPDTGETRDALSFFSGHPEFSLSRKEILKFILTEAGKRAKEVQALLKLESVDKNRAAFQTASNTIGRDAIAAEATWKEARKSLLDHLKIADLSKELLLNAINERRSLLGLTSFAELTSDIKVSDGIASDSKDPKKTIGRADALEKTDSVLLFLRGSEPSPSDAVKAALGAIEKLRNEPKLLSALNRQLLFETGLNLVYDDSCPLCDTNWEQSDLLVHLKDKIVKGKAVSQLQNSIETAANEVAAKFKKLNGEFGQLEKYATTLALVGESKAFLAAQLSLQAVEKSLLKPVEYFSSLEGIFAAPNSVLSNEVTGNVSALKEELSKLPDLSATESAKQYLTIADERLTKYRSARAEYEINKKRSTAANLLLKIFTETSESKLSELYCEVQNDFARFYSEINKDDEEQFSAKLEPQDGALNFEVDFYGRGNFPPNAYHSEGHQDGMGLCLYFALSKKLLGGQFSLCLLDDVLMSVDSGHRREVCKFLKAEFPDTQFIITTHDDVWSKQLALEGVVKGKNLLQFRKWTVDNGPAAWDLGEVWGEIGTDLESGNVSSAAHGLRRYLEFVASELAFKLRAPIEIRPAANYDLGELLPSVAGRYKDLLRKGKAAANSWNQQDAVAKIAIIDERFGRSYQSTNAEQWAVNASLHYNEWANLSAADFKNVLAAFDDLLRALKCTDCSSWYAVAPSKGSLESLRCDCGSSSINLKTNPN